MKQIEFFKMIGKNIRRYRRSQKMTQFELAELCNIHQGYISNIEKGKRNFSLQLFKRIADSLEVNYSELFEEWK